MISFGTEARETPYPAMLMPTVYDYIVFRGSNIKEIRVINPDNSYDSINFEKFFPNLNYRLQSETFSNIYQTRVCVDPCEACEDIDQNVKREVHNEVRRIGLSGLDCETISSFPINLDMYFPHLRSLHIFHQNINSISRQDLIGLGNLEDLYVTDSRLKSIPSNLFDNMRKLKKVNFSNNQLESISSELLKPIINNRLKLIDLRGNKKIDAFYSIRETGAVTLQELMDLIDLQCTKPPEDLRFDKSFGTKCSENIANLWKTRLGSDFKIITLRSKEILVHKLGSLDSFELSLYIDA